MVAAPRRAKPYFDWAFRHTATVQVPVCPGYTAPYGQGGDRTMERWQRGEMVEIIASEDCATYVSALTVTGSWINVWCLYNRRREPVGVHFCHITQLPIAARACRRQAV